MKFKGIDHDFITIAPTVDASRRTKNIINHHGSRVLLLKEGNPQCFNGADAILVSVGGYQAWLPTAEIHIRMEQNNGL